MKCEEDFLNFVAKMGNYFKLRNEKNLPFEAVNITCKKWRKPKTSQQHRLYFALINKLTKLFIENGYRVSADDTHQFIKAKSNFIKIIDGVVFTKSISDLSEDASITALSNLIEFVIEYAAKNFDVDLQADKCLY